MSDDSVSDKPFAALSGALLVELGGLDTADILGMSAGWRTTFVTDRTGSP